MITTTGKFSLRAMHRGMVALALGAGALALGGCVQMPPGPGPIYSRLPPDVSGVGVHPLTPAEKQRYAEIDRQTVAEQNQRMAADAQARAAWPGYYGGYGYGYYAPPISIYGGWGRGGWGRRGWGGGWGVGVGGWGW